MLSSLNILSISGSQRRWSGEMQACFCWVTTIAEQFVSSERSDENFRCTYFQIIECMTVFQYHFSLEQWKAAAPFTVDLIGGRFHLPHCEIVFERAGATSWKCETIEVVINHCHHIATLHVSIFQFSSRANRNKYCLCTSGWSYEQRAHSTAGA